MTHQEKLLALHLEELAKVLARAAELATAGTNASPDFSQSSRLSRVTDSIEQAQRHLEIARAPAETH